MGSLPLSHDEKRRGGEGGGGGCTHHAPSWGSAFGISHILLFLGARSAHTYKKCSAPVTPRLRRSRHLKGGLAQQQQHGGVQVLLTSPMEGVGSM